MNSLHNLNLKLEKLESQKKRFTSINDISVLQFIHYKRILSKEKKLCQKIERKEALGDEINFWYDSQTKSWIENPNINPRKYCRMEKYAEYKKNLKLYKLGIANKRPTHPILQNMLRITLPIKTAIKERFEDIKPILSKYNLFHKLNKKIKHFKSETLPKNINKLAIRTACVGIKGYKHLQNNCRYIRSSFASKDSIRFLKNVIEEANHQVNSSEKHNSFRESLKVENYNDNTAGYKKYCNEKIVVLPTYLSNLKTSELSLNKNIQKENLNYGMLR